MAPVRASLVHVDEVHRPSPARPAARRPSCRRGRRPRRRRGAKPAVRRGRIPVAHAGEHARACARSLRASRPEARRRKARCARRRPRSRCASVAPGTARRASSRTTSGDHMSGLRAGRSRRGRAHRCAPAIAVAVRARRRARSVRLHLPAVEVDAVEAGDRRRPVRHQCSASGASSADRSRARPGRRLEGMLLDRHEVQPPQARGIAPIASQAARKLSPSPKPVSRMVNASRPRQRSGSALPARKTWRAWARPPAAEW